MEELPLPYVILPPADKPTYPPPAQPGDLAPRDLLADFGVALKRVVNRRGNAAVNQFASDLFDVVNNLDLPLDVQDAANRVLTAFNVDVGHSG